MSRIEEACGEEKDVIVILKYTKKDEALQKIVGKLEVKQTFSGIMTKGKYKDIEISVYTTGKLLIKGLRGKEEAEELLEELLA